MHATQGAWQATERPAEHVMVAFQPAKNQSRPEVRSVRERVSYFESVTVRGARPPLPPTAAALTHAPSSASKQTAPDQAELPLPLRGGRRDAGEEGHAQQVHAKAPIGFSV